MVQRVPLPRVHPRGSEAVSALAERNAAVTGEHPLGAQQFDRHAQPAGAGTDDGQVKSGIDWGIAHAGNLAGGGAAENKKSVETWSL